MKILKFLLLALGAALLVQTLRSVGTARTLEELSGLGWKVVPLFSVYALIYAFNTWGWIYSFPKPLPRSVPFRDLYVIRIIGETLNNLIPWAASLGGEPVKAHLLYRKHGVPVSEGLASVLIVHTTFYLSLNAFLLGALAATSASRPLPPLLWKPVLIFLIVLGIGALILAGGLIWGLFRRIHAVGHRFHWWGEKTEEKARHYLELDAEIRRFYASDHRRFWLSTAFNFAAWMAGSLEVWGAARLLGIPMTLADAWLFEALIQAIRIVTFFIPASIGAQESGIVFLFTQMGLTAPAGLALALLRRAREILWMGAGLLFWAVLREGRRAGT